MDRRVKKSRNAIYNSLLELLSKNEFDNITIQEIADNADVSRGTIYLHYEDKYDLLDKLIKTHLDDLSNHCIPNHTQNAFQSVLVWIEYFQENKSIYRTLLSGSGSKYFRERFKDVIEGILFNKIKSFYPEQDDLENTIATHFIGSAFIGTLEWWLKEKNPCSVEVLTSKLEALMLKYFTRES